MSDSIAITSGKGGVGKTTIAVNLSIALKKISSEVFLLDTDLGMANSHVLLGVNPEHSISDVINNKKKISEIIVPSKSGVQLISGGTASNNLLNVENKKRYSILNQIDSHLKDQNDVKLVVDIAAGAEDNALVFAMACDRVVIVIIGEPTSFVDSYALLKAIFSKSSFKNYCVVVNQVKDEDQGKDLFNKFQKIKVHPLRFSCVHLFSTIYLSTSHFTNQHFSNSIHIHIKNVFILKALQDSQTF